MININQSKSMSTKSGDSKPKEKKEETKMEQSIPEAPELQITTGIFQLDSYFRNKRDAI
jgi:hypothetical protein